MYIGQEGLIEFNVFLLDLGASSFHFFLNLSDLLVSLIDGKGLYLLRQGQFLDSIFELL